MGLEPFIYISSYFLVFLVFFTVFNYVFNDFYSKSLLKPSKKHVEKSRNIFENEQSTFLKIKKTKCLENFFI